MARTWKDIADAARVRSQKDARVEAAVTVLKEQHENVLQHEAEVVDQIASLGHVSPAVVDLHRDKLAEIRQAHADYHEALLKAVGA